MKIASLPDPILRRPAEDVSADSITSPKIRRLIDDMKAALRESKDGVGIAAPQIGVSQRIFLVSEEAKFADREGPRDSDKVWTYYVYINPVITNYSRRKTEDAEGCLSVPGTYGVVARPEKVTIEAYDENGKKFSHGASKFFARVLQHEVDHLEGTLFVDKVSRFVKIESPENKP